MMGYCEGHGVSIVRAENGFVVTVTRPHQIPDMNVGKLMTSVMGSMESDNPMEAIKKFASGEELVAKTRRKPTEVYVTKTVIEVIKLLEEILPSFEKEGADEA